MDVSHYLAILWGVTLAVVSLALLKDPKRLETFLAEKKNGMVMFFWGVVTFVIGLAMVLVHNVWVLDWPVVITLLGWLTVLKGLDLLFLPERMEKRWTGMKQRHWLLIFTSLFLLGLAIALLGFLG